MAYTKRNKETTNSDIFYKPDKRFKIWFYIISTVNRKDSDRLPRWSWRFTYDMIMIATWASKTQVYKCIKRMRETDMVETTKRIRWMDLKVNNYNKYQDEGLQRDVWETTERQWGDNGEVDTITKEWIMNNEKEISFDEFWKLYPNKKWKSKAQKLFKSKIKTSLSFEQLMLWLEWYINRKPNEQGFKASDQQWDTFMSKETRKDYLDDVPIDIQTAEQLALMQEDLQIYKNYLVKTYWDKRIDLYWTDYSRVKKLINEKSLIPLQ